MLHRSVGPEPDSLDLHRAQSVSALNVLRDLHEGLLIMDAHGQPVAGLAQTWQVSEDGLSWRFQLHPEARFSDGSPVRAQDFVAGWRRALDPVTASPLAWMLDGIRGATELRAGRGAPEALGVRAEAEDLLVVELERPLPWFETLLTQPLMAPWRESDPPLYTGAFMLVEQVPGAHMRLVANPQHAQHAGRSLDGVVWHVMEQPGVELARFRAGGLHITETIPPGRADWLARNLPEQLRIAPYLGSFYLAFNLSRPPFADQPELRRALSLAIDREILTERVIGSGELPAWGLIPPGMPGWPEGVEAALPEASRLAEARRLYEAAGYSEEQPLTVELRINTSLAQRRVASAVAAMWKMHLGVRTRLVNEEWKVFIANRRHGRLTEVVRGGWIADWPDAANFLELFASDSPGNYAFFKDRPFDVLMRQAARQSGEERLVTLRQAERRLLDQQVIIPLYYHVSRHLVDPAVRGFEDNPMDVHLSRWLALP